MSESEEFLRTVKKGNEFKIREGREIKQIKSLEELSKELKKMNSRVFKKYVTHKKNSFGRWVSKIIGDHRLGDAIEGVFEKQDMANIIKMRVDSLKHLKDLQEKKGKEISKKNIVVERLHNIYYNSKNFMLIGIYDFLAGVIIGATIMFIILRLIE